MDPPLKWGYGAPTVHTLKSCSQKSVKHEVPDPAEKKLPIEYLIVYVPVSSPRPPAR